MVVDAGTWFTAPGYSFRISFLFDRLSIPFAALTIGLGGVVGVFAERYLHREPGHIAGHACMRSLQFLRAPSLLHDFHQVENAVGGHLAHPGRHLEWAVPGAWQRRLYAWALEGGGLDALLDALVVRPFVRLFSACDRFERRWVARVAARPRVRAGGGR